MADRRLDFVTWRSSYSWPGTAGTVGGAAGSGVQGRIDRPADVADNSFEIAAKRARPLTRWPRVSV